MSYQSGEVIVLTVSPTESPTASDSTTTTSMTLEPWTTDPLTSLNPTTTNDGGVSNIIQGGAQPASEDKSSDLSVPSIVIIAVTMALIVLIILLFIVQRHRRGTTTTTYTDREGYNSNGSTALDVDKLELDSPTPSRYGQRGMSITSPSRGGGGGGPPPILVTSFTAPDDYDDFDDYHSTGVSPSRRAQRGPLTSQDEFDGSTYDEHVLASHRGGINNNNNYNNYIVIEPPRTYPIQDTVNL
jgi:hypothetical protein